MPNKTISVEMLSANGEFHENSPGESMEEMSQIKLDEKKKPNFVTNIKNNISELANKHKRLINRAIFIFLNVIIVVYFAYATQYFLESGKDVEFCTGYGFLILLVMTVYFLIFYYYIFLPYLYESFIEKWDRMEKKLEIIIEIGYIRWIIYFVISVILLGFLVFDSLDKPNRLIALAGFFLLVFIGVAFSKNPGQIKPRPVICGLFVQFALGLFTIRWEVGRNIFDCAGHKATTFLKYTDVGASFVYGKDLVETQTIFAFEAMSVIFFLSFMVHILYYYGIVQKIVMGLGIILQKLMGTTICESVNAAANIFLGMTESPILLKEYLKDLTLSEIHAVMASGFAAVSGTVLVAYINYGASATHLITASVMSAPASLCFSKLFYPETEETKSTKDKIVLAKNEDASVLDAACKGASLGIEIVLGIIANVIAFVAFIAFINGVVGWFGILVGYDNWSVEEFLSYVLMPLSFLMGVPWDECQKVAKLIGIKTIINEFSAYQVLGEMKKAQELTERSQAIATYAICGFSNPGSVGIMISTMSTLMPGKRQIITSLVVRAFVSGAIVCFMTACIAGMLID